MRRAQIVVQAQGKKEHLRQHQGENADLSTQKCRQECKKACPVVRSGKLCIEVATDSKLAFISESLCGKFCI